MKKFNLKNFTSSILILLLSGCGSPIDLGSAPSKESPPAAPIPSGALMYLDSAYVSGTFGAPSAGCGTLNWQDLSGNGNVGTLTSFTCTGNSGWTGSGTTTDPYALAFDGSGRVPTTLDVKPATLPSTTWEIWVKPTRLNYGTRQQLLSDDDGGYDRSLLIEQSTSSLAAFTGSAVWIAVTADLNTWQHVAVVFTASDIFLYKNGTSYSYGSAPTFGSTVKNLMVGSNPAFGEQFQGEIALLAIYNRELSATEISTHCKQYSPRFAGVVCN